MTDAADLKVLQAELVRRPHPKDNRLILQVINRAMVAEDARDHAIRAGLELARHVRTLEARNLEDNRINTLIKQGLLAKIEQLEEALTKKMYPRANLELIK